jgi:hypothetical protein
LQEAVGADLCETKANVEAMLASIYTSIPAPKYKVIARQGFPPGIEAIGVHKIDGESFSNAYLIHPIGFDKDGNYICWNKTVGSANSHLFAHGDQVKVTIGSISEIGTVVAAPENAQDKSDLGIDYGHPNQMWTLDANTGWSDTGDLLAKVAGANVGSATASDDTRLSGITSGKGWCGFIHLSDFTAGMLTVKYKCTFSSHFTIDVLYALATPATPSRYLFFAGVTDINSGDFRLELNATADAVLTVNEIHLWPLNGIMVTFPDGVNLVESTSYNDSPSGGVSVELIEASES